MGGMKDMLGFLQSGDVRPGQVKTRGWLTLALLYLC